MLRFLTRFFEEGLAWRSRLVLQVLHYSAVLLGTTLSTHHLLLLLQLLLLGNVVHVVSDALGEFVVRILVNVAQLTAGFY